MINVKPLCISKWISVWTSVKLRNKQEANTLKSNMCDLEWGLYSVGQYWWNPALIGAIHRHPANFAFTVFSIVVFFFLLWMHVKYVGKIKFKVCVPALRAWGILHAAPPLIATSFMPDARKVFGVLTHRLADSVILGPCEESRTHERQQFLSFVDIWH